MVGHSFSFLKADIFKSVPFRFLNILRFLQENSISAFVRPFMLFRFTLQNIQWKDKLEIPKAHQFSFSLLPQILWNQIMALHMNIYSFGAINKKKWELGESLILIMNETWIAFPIFSSPSTNHPQNTNMVVACSKLEYYDQVSLQKEKH